MDGGALTSTRTAVQYKRTTSRDHTLVSPTYPNREGVVTTETGNGRRRILLYTDKRVSTLDNGVFNKSGI